MTNNIQIENAVLRANGERPWWEVRAPLAATLAVLVLVLVTLLSSPQTVEKTLRLAGF